MLLPFWILEVCVVGIVFLIDILSSERVGGLKTDFESEGHRGADLFGQLDGSDFIEG